MDRWIAQQHGGARRRLPEDVRCCCRGQIVGYATETAAKRLLVHCNGLEEKRGLLTKRLLPTLPHA
jgi:hypothetical protein